MNTFAFPETVWQDLSYALRTMRKNPAFSVTAILTLALGIGGNTAMFTVIYAVLLKPLDYRDPDRLVRVSVDYPRQNMRDIGFSLERYGEMKGAVRSFSEFGASGPIENLTLTGSAEPEVLRGARVSGNFLSILGVSPILGRTFLPEEDKSGGRPVAMISAELWRRRFGGDRQIVGQSFTLDSTPYTIIGVLPGGFQFPVSGVDMWVTRPSEWSEFPPQTWATAIVLTGIARLKPGVSVEQARAELNVLNQQYVTAHPADAGTTMRVAHLMDRMVVNVRPMLWMLFGAVSFVLLIACANVASLLLARATSRSREFAVRAALGAARGRLIRQLLAESLTLAVTGGGLGVLLATWGLSAITRASAFNLPRAAEIRLDGFVLGFTVLLSIATGSLFGLFPALHISRPDLADALRERGAGLDGGSRRRGKIGVNTRSLLVVGQVALSVVLLIGATLLIKSFVRLQKVDPGFQSSNLLTMKIALSQRYDDLKERAFFEELVRRVETLPGVRGAAIARTLPMTPGYGILVSVAEQPPVNVSDRPVARLQTITPGYFRTLSIPLKRGREFTERDGSDAAKLAIINESLARRFWPAYPNGQDPVGQHLQTGPITGAPEEIIGIVADVHENSLDADAGPAVYVPFGKGAPRTEVLLVRTEGDPRRFVNAVRSQVLAIDRDQPVTAVRTMEEVIDVSFGRRRLTLLLLGLFAGIALLLSVVGIYGVIAYSVAQRTQELGIRRALGAQQGDILRLVVGQGLGLTLAGVVAGISGAFGLTEGIKGLLFQTSATDLATFVGVAVVFVAVAVAASSIPALRATHVDPMATLRIG